MHSIYEGYKVFAPYTSFNGSTKSYFYGYSKLEILVKTLKYATHATYAMTE